GHAAGDGGGEEGLEPRSAAAGGPADPPVRAAGADVLVPERARVARDRVGGDVVGDLPGAARGVNEVGAGDQQQPVPGGHALPERRGGGAGAGGGDRAPSPGEPAVSRAASAGEKGVLGGVGSVR